MELAASRSAQGVPKALDTRTIGQKDKEFAPGRVRIRVGESIVIWNNDTRPHNVRIAHPKMNYISDMQEPGDKLTLPFPTAGTYEALCGIHPNMRLVVEVEGQ